MSSITAKGPNNNVNHVRGASQTPSSSAQEASTGSIQDLTPRAAAQWYKKLGWKPIPVGTNKVPMVKGWTTKEYTDDEIKQWSPAWQVGVVTGDASGFVAVDIDSAKALTFALEFLEPTPLIAYTSLGPDNFRRQHWWYRIKPGLGITNRSKIKIDGEKIALDLRADHGYVVVPPSLHASGMKYEWKTPPWELDLDTVPEFDPTALPIVNHEAYRASEVRGGRPDPTTSDIAEEYAQRYLDRMGPATENRGGDTHTFNVCCAICVGYNFPYETALELLSQWNKTCLPPWPEEDLRAKIGNALRYANEPWGGRRHDDFWPWLEQRSRMAQIRSGSLPEHEESQHGCGSGLTDENWTQTRLSALWRHAEGK